MRRQVSLYPCASSAPSCVHKRHDKMLFTPKQSDRRDYQADMSTQTDTCKTQISQHSNLKIESLLACGTDVESPVFLWEIF